MFSLQITEKSDLKQFIDSFNLATKHVLHFNGNIQLVLNPIPTEEFRTYNHIERDVYELKINLDKNSYTVRKITDALYPIERILPEIETEERRGLCHSLSLELATITSQLGMQPTLVTGYIYGLNENTKLLHSWLELKNNIIFDGTLNVFLDKELYQRLQKHEEVSRFNGKTVKCDYENAQEIFQTMGKELSLKCFLVLGQTFLNTFYKLKEHTK